MEDGRMIPGFATAFSVVDSDAIASMVSGQKRHHPYFRSWTDLHTYLGIVSPNIIKRLSTTKAPVFKWEKTGHGPTNRQREMIVQVARSSGIVTRSQTTHQHPKGGKRSQAISKTDRSSEFTFSVSDRGNVLTGIFYTKAITPEESQTALIVLRQTYERLFGQM